jgi:hypothetical protein
MYNYDSQCGRRLSHACDGAEEVPISFPSLLSFLTALSAVEHVAWGQAWFSGEFVNDLDDQKLGTSK